MTYDHPSTPHGNANPTRAWAYGDAARLERAAANLARIEECAATRGHEPLRTLAAMKLAEAKATLVVMGRRELRGRA
jgi:hypothetical protein